MRSPLWDPFLKALGINVKAQETWDRASSPLYLQGNITKGCLLKPWWNLTPKNNNKFQRSTFETDYFASSLFRGWKRPLRPANYVIYGIWSRQPAGLVPLASMAFEGWRLSLSFLWPAEFHRTPLGKDHKHTRRCVKVITCGYKRKLKPSSRNSFVVGWCELAHGYEQISSELQHMARDFNLANKRRGNITGDNLKRASYCFADFLHFEIHSSCALQHRYFREL